MERGASHAGRSYAWGLIRRGGAAPAMDWVRARLLRSQLRVNMVTGMAAACATAVVIALSYRVYLQLLGYELYGLWLLLTTVLTLIQLGSLGLAPALARLIAEDKERGHVDAIPTHIITALISVAAWGTLILAAGLPFRAWIVDHLRLTPTHADIAYRLLPYVVALSIYALVIDTLSSALSGLGRVDIHHYTQTAASVVAAIVSMVLLTAGYGLGSLLIGQGVSYLVLQMVTVTILRRSFQVTGLTRARWNAASFTRLTAIGWSLVGSSIVHALLAPLNRYLLTRYAGVAAIPVYDLSYNATMRLRNVAEAGVQAIMPEISQLNVRRGQDDIGRMRYLQRKTVLRLMAVGGPIYALLLALSPLVLQLWLGPSYEPTLASAFRIALVGSFLSLLGVPAFYALLGLGRARPLLVEKLLHAGTSATLAVTFVLGPWHGVSPALLLLAGACGMGLSTAYLIRQYHAEMVALTARADGAGAPGRIRA